MMARVRVGDDVALGLIVDRYGGIVSGIASRLVGPDHAQDVTQEIFLHLWQHPDSYDADRGGLTAYLAVAARRRAIDTVRSRERRESRERRVGEVTRQESGVEAAALASVVARDVRAAIDRLPTEQRRAVELAYLDGLTYRQVAAVMSTSEGTAKSRLRLGLARLARDLAGMTSDEELSWI